MVSNPTKKKKKVVCHYPKEYGKGAVFSCTLERNSTVEKEGYIHQRLSGGLKEKIPREYHVSIMIGNYV